MNKNVLCNKIENLPLGDWWMAIVNNFHNFRNIVRQPGTIHVDERLFYYYLFISIFQIVWKLKELQ